MIFYFSGTGNSKHVAESMCDERMVNIGDACKNGEYEYSIGNEESVGFVMPVYYSGIPKTVLEFVRNLTLNGEITYSYCILTHGGGPGAAGSMLQRELGKKGYPLHACFDVRMFSNYIMFGPLKSEEKEKKYLREAEGIIADIKNKVDAKTKELPGWTAIDKFLTLTMYPLCDRYMSTKKFYADGTCTGCGLCVKRCPSGLIKMKDGRPVWEEDKCVRCMGCLQCKSVQCGHKTKNYRRYSYKKQ